MSEIKVSVIMPVYNAETYLEEAIECLICQHPGGSRKAGFHQGHDRGGSAVKKEMHYESDVA